MDTAQQKVAQELVLYSDQQLVTDDPQVAAVLMLFGAQLQKHCPVEWIDVHETRENFLQNLQDCRELKEKKIMQVRKEFKPKPKLIFNLDFSNVPVSEITKAIGQDLQTLRSELDQLLYSLDKRIADQLRDCISKLVARSAKEALGKRNELAWIKQSVPENAKMDHINGYGKACVQIGKNSSPELRAHYLSKL